MGPKRLFIQDLEDRHLTLLARAVGSIPQASATVWLKSISDGSLELWDGFGGLVCLQPRPECLFIEFLVGDGMIARRAELMVWLRSFNRPLECIAPNRALARLYARMGYREMGTWMRAE